MVFSQSHKSRGVLNAVAGQFTISIFAQRQEKQSRTNMVFDADQILYETAVAALPSATVARRSLILRALQVRLSHRHPAYKNINAQISLIETLEKLQAELPFEISGGSQ